MRLFHIKSGGKTNSGKELQDIDFLPHLENLDLDFNCVDVMWAWLQ